MNAQQIWTAWELGFDEGERYLVAVFTDQSLANIAKLRNPRWVMTQDFPLNPRLDLIPRNHAQFTVHFYVNGNSTVYGPQEDRIDIDGLKGIAPEGKRNTTGKDYDFIFFVYAKDKDDALAQAAAMRAHMLANNLSAYTGEVYQWSVEGGGK